MRRPLSAAGAALGGAGRFLARLAIGLVAYVLDLVRTAGQGWHRFFFTPANPTPLGLIRIAVGLLLAWSFLTIGLDLRGNLGTAGWADPDALRTFWSEWKRDAPAWSLWLLVPDRALPAAWAAGLLVLALFTLGLWSRVTAVLSWVLMVSTVRRAPVLFFGFDQTVLTWMMYLAATGASGQALSLDRFLARRRKPASVLPVPTVSANLGLRLIQLHLCLIYGVAGLTKLEGKTWWSGEAVLIILGAPEYRVRDFTWLAAYPYLLNLLTHATVALEVLYPILIWFPAFRPLMLAGMIGLHVGIDQTLGLTEFSLSMIAGNLAFVPARWLRGRFRPPAAAHDSPA